jgi:hypothetical protein
MLSLQLEGLISNGASWEATPPMVVVEGRFPLGATPPTLLVDWRSSYRHCFFWLNAAFFPPGQ